MKGYTDFIAPLFGVDIATKPRGDMKYLDWEKAKQLIKEHPDSVIHAGLMEDWEWTSGLIYAKGNFYDGYVYGSTSALDEGDIISDVEKNYQTVISDDNKSCILEYTR
jgi:hypothetical protein